MQRYKGKPKLLIGVDVATESLRLANDLGYAAVLADANNLPFKSGIAGTLLSLQNCIATQAIQLSKYKPIATESHPLNDRISYVGRSIGKMSLSPLGFPMKLFRNLLGS